MRWDLLWGGAGRVGRCRTGIALLGLLLASCAQTVASVPAPISGTPHDFGRLKGAVTAVTVLDRRAKQDDTSDLVSRVHDDIANALERDGVRVGEGGGDPDARVTVRIHEIDANFERGNWQGCTRVSYTLRMREGEESEDVPLERCVKKSNLWGTETAHEVLDQAYAEAMSELLSKLEQSISRGASAK
jgi:hypothetical protein